MTEPLLAVRGLCKSFPDTRGRRVQVLQPLDFDIHAGRSLALVGESGSGKSTAALCVARLLQADAGSVVLEGQELLSADRRRERALRRRFGLVLQNPLTSLDPRQTVWASVAEPLEIHEPALNAAERWGRALTWLARVGLSEDMGDRKPHQLSGGQLQRAVVARALVLQPALLILDEPTSALDVSVQAQLLNLLCDLRDELGLSYLFITHNLALVEVLAHDVLVLQGGQVVERGPVHQVFGAPAQPYTAELLASVPGRPHPFTPTALHP